MENLKITADNRVIIRVWTSQWNKHHPGQNVGHVSIETESPKGYYSLWPTDQGKNQGPGLFKPIQKEFKRTYQADRLAEDRDPELTICLYSLNIKGIIKKFNDIKDNLAGWRLVGSNVLSRKLKSTNKESCASLAYRLLLAGDIDDLTSSHSSKAATIVSPDDLGGLIKDAKKVELKDYPETKKFTYEDETPLAEEKEASSCTIL